MNTRTLEKAYFHISNSGITLTLEEDITPVNSALRENIHEFYMSAQLSAYGVPLTVRVPMPNPAFVDWLSGALSRVRTRMVEVESGSVVQVRPPRVEIQNGASVEPGSK